MILNPEMDTKLTCEQARALLAQSHELLLEHSGLTFHKYYVCIKVIDCVLTVIHH